MQARPVREKAVGRWTTVSDRAWDGGREGSGRYMLGTEESVGLTDASHIAKARLTDRLARRPPLPHSRPYTTPHDVRFRFKFPSLLSKKSSNTYLHILSAYLSLYAPLKVMIFLDLPIPNSRLMSLLLVPVFLPTLSPSL